MTDATVYSSASPLSLIPAGGHVHFTASDGETWTEPVVALAVVVQSLDHTELDPYGRGPTAWVTETAVEPVVVSGDGYTITLSERRMDFDADYGYVRSHYVPGVPA